MQSLLNFSRKQQAVRLTHTIVWPLDTPVAVIGAQIDRELESGRVKSLDHPPQHPNWRRLPEGSIEATYHSKEELELSLILTGWLKEWATPVSDYQQTSLLPTGDDYYKEG